MGSKFLRLEGGLLFLLLFFIASCSLNLEMKKPEGEKEFFIQEISRLEGLAREDPSASVRAKSHLKLAFLYVNSRNPRLNYARALQEMNAYLFMWPAKSQKDAFQNWLAVLREVDHLSKVMMEMEKKNQSLQAQHDKLNVSLEMVQKERTAIEIENQSLRAERDKLHGGLEKVRKNYTHLREEVANLKEINNKMTEAIERLKNLDLQMEEKRSLIK